MEGKKKISNQKKEKKEKKRAFGCLAIIFGDITDHMSRQRTRHQILQFLNDSLSEESLMDRRELPRLAS